MKELLKQKVLVVRGSLFVVRVAIPRMDRGPNRSWNRPRQRSTTNDQKLIVSGVSTRFASLESFEWKLNLFHATIADVEKNFAEQVRIVIVPFDRLPNRATLFRHLSFCVESTQ